MICHSPSENSFFFSGSNPDFTVSVVGFPPDSANATATIVETLSSGIPTLLTKLVNFSASYDCEFGYVVCGDDD